MKSNSKGVRLPANAVVVLTQVKRILSPHAAAWEAWSEGGSRLHIGYRPGELIVLEARLQEGGSLHWQALLRCRPELMEVEAEVLRSEGERRWLDSAAARRRSRKLLRERLRLEAENHITAMCRAWNWTRRGAEKSGPAKVSWKQVREWFELREEHWEVLQRAGLAGGLARVKVEAWWDGEW